MRWTKLKQRIEERFAEELRGRLEVHVTRYRKSHDALHELWFMLDQAKIADWSEGKCFNYAYNREIELASLGLIEKASLVAWDEAKATEYLASDLMSVLFDSLSLSIDQLLEHKNLAVRALAIADARLGQRRLAQIDETTCSPLEQTILAARRQSKSKGREASDAVLAVGSPQ